MSDDDRIVKLENLLFEFNKEMIQFRAAYLIREYIADDLETENKKMREVLLELAYINDPEEKAIIARKFLTGGVNDGTRKMR